MCLRDIDTALKTVCPAVYHHGAAGAQKAPYIVWGEDGQSAAMWANNRMESQTLTGTVDYFTLTEYDPHFITIQAALNSLEDLSWRLNSIQREDETGLLHYEWVWEAVGEWPG